MMQFYFTSYGVKFVLYLGEEYARVMKRTKGVGTPYSDFICDTIAVIYKFTEVDSAEDVLEIVDMPEAKKFVQRLEKSDLMLKHSATAGWWAPWDFDSKDLPGVKNLSD